MRFGIAHSALPTPCLAQGRCEAWLCCGGKTQKLSFHLFPISVYSHARPSWRTAPCAGHMGNIHSDKSIVMCDGGKRD